MKVHPIVSFQYHDDNQFYIGLQVTDVSLDARITALEESGEGDSSGNGL